MSDKIALEKRYGATNYAPLPVVLSRGEGVWLWDDEGRKYLDMLSAYSAVSFGYGHPKLLKVLNEQAARLAVTSRAFHSDTLPPFLAKLCEITGMDRALPMSTGAEGVETAIKCARKWAYTVKKVPDGKAEIIVCDNNFHGRTSTIVGFSSEAQYRDGFGPYATQGFKHVPFGDAKALEAAITPNTAAFLVEPVQGEAGIIVPPAGYLAEAARICKAHDVLLIVDEVQTGLGRTGHLWGVEGFGVEPDVLVTGKGLSGGLYPMSAVVMTHAAGAWLTEQGWGYVSTFGGAELGCRIAARVLDRCSDPAVLAGVRRTAARVGAGLADLQARHPFLVGIRQRGVVIGLETASSLGGMQLSRALYPRGVWAMFSGFAPSVLQFKVGLLVDDAYCDELLTRLDLALGDVERELA